MSVGVGIAMGARKVPWGCNWLSKDLAERQPHSSGHAPLAALDAVAGQSKAAQRKKAKEGASGVTQWAKMQ